LAWKKPSLAESAASCGLQQRPDATRRAYVRAGPSHGSIERTRSSQCHDRLVGLRRWAKEACMRRRHQAGDPTHQPFDHLEASALTYERIFSGQLELGVGTHTLINEHGVLFLQVEEGTRRHADAEGSLSKKFAFFHSFMQFVARA
jgi:hypothetical protein